MHRFLWRLKIHQIEEDSRSYREAKIKSITFLKLKNYVIKKNILKEKQREQRKKQLKRAIKTLYEYYKENMLRAEKEKEARKFYYWHAVRSGFLGLKRYLETKKAQYQRELKYHRYYCEHLRKK